MGGLFLLGSVFGVLAILVPVSLVLGLVVLLALRGEPDDGGRGMTLYLALASFVGFLTVLIAVTALAAAATDLVANDDEDEVSFPSVTSFDSGSSSSSGSVYDLGSSSDSGDVSSSITRGGSGITGRTSSVSRGDVQSDDDRAWTSIIQALLALGAALAVLRFHWPKLEAVGNRAEATASAAKARAAYCYTMCFLVVVTLLVAATVATFNVVQMIAPGTTGAHDRGDAIQAFIPVFVLAVGALGLFRLHWARIDPPAFLRPLPPPPPPAPTPEPVA